MPLLVLLACYLFAAHAVAAAPASGERWQQIQQPQFNLIFQAKIVAEAERVADALNQYLANHLSEMPLDRPIRPFSLVLHANAHSSNGYVGLRPYRSNWYNKPAAFSGLEWYDTLAVHEGRHLIQFNQLLEHELVLISLLHAHLRPRGSPSTPLGAAYIPRQPRAVRHTCSTAT